MSFYLAVDSGGTKTDYLLADDRRELARVRTDTIKRMRTDAATATRHLESALAQLTRKSGIPMSIVTCTCIGTAGETVSLVTDWIREAFFARVAGELILLGDVEIALDAAFPGQPGAIVLAGTGSNVAGRTHAGAMTSAGGWGPALADQGSGHRIGHSALRAAFLACDEGRDSSLIDAFLLTWNLHAIEELIEFANRIPSPDFSTLTTLVVRCAAQGDAVAQAVLQQEGADLGYLIRLVMRRLRATSPDASWTPPVAFAGSIMERVAPVRQALIDDVCKEFPDVKTLDGVVDPIAGALWRARAGR